MATAMVVLILMALVISQWSELVQKRAELREKSFVREMRFAIVIKLAERLVAMPNDRAEIVVKEFESLIVNGRSRRSKADV